MANFKVGDRVVLVRHSSDSKEKLGIGQEGTVVKPPSGGSTRVGVRWDGLTDGHSCSCCCEDGCGWYVDEDSVRLVVEEAKPKPEKPPVESAKPKPVKPKPWFAPIESSIEDLLEMSFEFKPASELASALGNWTVPKPQEAASKPKPEPKKETKPKKDGCWKCTAYQQIADCEYGFCSSWHNFAGKEELCSRFKAVETVDN